MPDEDGDWEFGLSLAGSGNLFIDKKLVIDLSTNPEQGESFFGLGTIDVRAVVPKLKAGQTYDLELRVSNGTFIARGSPFKCWGGIRIGGIQQIDDDEAIGRAVKIAKESDGGFSYSVLRYISFDYLSSRRPGNWA